jgi:hypothetical protein
LMADRLVKDRIFGSANPEYNKFSDLDLECDPLLKLSGMIGISILQASSDPHQFIILILVQLLRR